MEYKMVTAIVLINAETNKINDLAQELTEIDGVREVFSVAGRYDLAAIVSVRENDQLAVVISDKMRHLDGIKSSETLIAFRMYSQTELRAGLDFGLD